MHDNPFHELVAGPYFQVPGVDAQVGRILDPGEGVVAGADPAVVLSDEYWRRTLDGDPGVVGRIVWLNGFPYTIVGMAPRGSGGALRGIKSAMWTHASMADQISLVGGDGGRVWVMRVHLEESITRSSSSTIASWASPRSIAPPATSS